MAGNSDQLVFMFFGALLALVPAIAIIKLIQKVSAQKLYFATNIAFIALSVFVGLTLLSRLASGEINMPALSSWRTWLIVIFVAVIDLIALSDAINAIKKYRQKHN